MYNCQKEYEKVTEVQETKNGEIFQSSEFTEIVNYIETPNCSFERSKTWEQSIVNSHLNVGKINCSYFIINRISLCCNLL